jgi:signal transduction histidine kinase
MRVKAEEKGLAFEYALGPDVPAAVTIDETRLRQVLLNLLGNAVKFTDRGTVSLRVSRVPSSAGDDAGVRLRFEVADTGIGMSPQQLGRLFQPFEQVADMRRRHGPGPGHQPATGAPHGRQHRRRQRTGQGQRVLVRTRGAGRHRQSGQRTGAAHDRRL